MVTRVDFFTRCWLCYGIILMFRFILTRIQRRMYDIVKAALTECCDLGWVLSFSFCFSVFSPVIYKRHAFLLLRQCVKHV